LFVLTARARSPAEIRTSKDIESTPSSWYAISIGDLPLSLYPQLSKFSQVEHVFFKGTTGWATDEKLKALAALSMPNLRDIVLGGSVTVTDEGVFALTHLASVELLQLSGTAISDRGIEALSQFPKLTGVNIVECRRVSVDALKALVQQRAWQDLSFSAERLSSKQVAELLAQLRPKAYCMVVDASVHLDESLLRKVAVERGISLNLRKNPIYPGYR
jgi:hypothetical protein